MQKTELFNTHQFVKDLTKAGMNEKQAEILADHQLAMLETHIATKADIVNLEGGVTEVKADIKWIKALTMATAIPVIVATMKYIFFDVA